MKRGINYKYFIKIFFDLYLEQIHYKDYKKLGFLKTLSYFYM